MVVCDTDELGAPVLEVEGSTIEDDVAVTDHGHENLTAAALKAPVAMER